MAFARRIKDPSAKMGRHPVTLSFFEPDMTNFLNPSVDENCFNKGCHGGFPHSAPHFVESDQDAHKIQKNASVRGENNTDDRCGTRPGMSIELTEHDRQQIQVT